MLVLLHLFALFLLVLLGFYVFVTDPRSRANQTFAAFIAFLALWTTKDLIFWNFHDSRIGSDWWVATSFIIALLMQYALVIFAWVFPENTRVPKRKAAVLFAPGLILVPAALFGWLWKNVSVSDGRFDIELAPLAYAFVAYVYFLFCVGAWLLFRKYNSYRGSQNAQQVGAVLWALIVTGILKTAANIAFPYFENFSLLPYSSIFVLPGVLIYAYAISNFKLFSFQTALDQFRLFPITYKIAVIIATVAIVSFVLFQIPIVWWAFHDGPTFEAWRRYLVFSVISALVPNLLLLLLVVRTISRPLERIALAAVRVTNGEYGTEVGLRKSNDEIGLLADSFNEMSRKMRVDIDRLKSMNEQLMRSDRLAAMGTLAAGVAHEVNNPLAAISSMIQMIQKNGMDDLAETTEQLNLISEQIARIKRVTKDLTDFARARPAAKSFTNVNEVVRASLRLATFDSSFQKIKVETSFYDSIEPIFADSDQLQQVFLNLFLNAKDAMPNGGLLSIETSTETTSTETTSTETAIVVRIADSGKGIDKAAAKQIFDPFFTTKPAGQGTGLGLAVCYGIVTAHGGTIEVRANSSGGTTFDLKFSLVTNQNEFAA